MTPKLIEELRAALASGGRESVEIEDPQTHQVYVLMTRREFQRLVYDDTELSEEEMLAAAGSALIDPQGWDAPGMESYDRDNTEPPST